jgi:hypothetical protein
MYQLIRIDPLTGQAVQGIKRLADNAFIPMDRANTDYQTYFAWLTQRTKPSRCIRTC